RSLVPARVGPDAFRRRVAAENLRWNNLGRSLVVQTNVGLAREVSRLEFINRSRRRLVGGLPVKRAANEKECRVPTLSHPRSKVVARLGEPSRDRDNRKAERKGQVKKHRRQGHNSSDTIIALSGSGTRSPGAAFFVRAAVVAHLCQTGG